MAFIKILSLILFIGVASASTESTLSQHPSVVQVEFLLDLGVWLQSCVGSILNSRNVLSSSSCFPADISTRRLRAGANIRNNGGSILYIDRVIKNKNNSSDISVLRLSSFITYTPLIRQARIPGPSFVLPNGVIMKQVGWERRDFAGPLIAAEVASLNNALCGVEDSSRPDIICARFLRSVEILNVDVGGPWIINNVTVGFVSGKNNPEVYSNIFGVAVAPFTDWIISVAI